MTEQSASEQKTVTAAVLIIGNEILSGRTKDKNLGYMADWLQNKGVRLMEARIIADIEGEIAEAVNVLRSRYDYVFTSGGIGPTHDDITADSMATAFGVGIDYDPRAMAILESHYEEGQFNEARKRMARIPFGADLIENPISKAPGFILENVYVMAGVPIIMQAMLESVRHRITGGAKVLSGTIGTALPEGTLAGPLGEIQDDFPDADIGSYPFYLKGQAGVNLVVRTTESDALEQILDRIRIMIRGLGGEPHEGDTRPPEDK